LDVLHEAEDVVGDEAADRTAAVDTDEHVAVRVDDEAGRLDVERVVIDEGTGGGGELSFL